MSDDDSKSGESFALFEIVQLANGDIVLRDPESDDKQLLKIRFAPEIRALLGNGALQLAKVMVEAIVSRSLISPTNRTSGSWRRKCLSASPKVLVCASTSR